MRKPWLLLALLLPVLWFAGSWVVQQRAIMAGSNWTIPVEGYDPRDLVRGHYIRFRYMWQVEGNPDLCRNATCDLCLTQTGATVIATLAAAPALCRHRVGLAPSEIRMLKRQDQLPQFFSRIFVSESAAPQLEQTLRQGGVHVEATLTPEGRLVNQRLITLPAGQNQATAPGG